MVPARGAAPLATSRSSDLSTATRFPLGARCEDPQLAARRSCRE